MLRALRLIRPGHGRHRFWDSPVPHEHTHECTYDNMQALGARWMEELEACYGVSLFWGVPGWGRLLKRLPKGPVNAVLSFFDSFAYRWPRIGDAVIFVWRRPKAAAAE